MDRRPLIVNQRAKGSIRNRIDRLSHRLSRWLTIRVPAVRRPPRRQTLMQLIPAPPPTIDDWCRFPKLTCICPTTYEKLDEVQDIPAEVIRDAITTREYEESTSKPSTSKQSPSKKSPKKHAKAGASTSFDDKTKKAQKRYPIYTVRNVRHDVALEEKLNAASATRLVSILEGNNVKEEDIPYHGIVEEWHNLGAERMLEDHEYVLPSWNCLKAYRRHRQDAIVKYCYRRETDTKYAIFENPLAYLDKHYLYPHALDPSQEVDQEELKISMLDENWTPTLYSHAYFEDRDHDEKYFLVLKFNSVYTFEDQDTALSFLKATEHMTLKDQAWDLQRLEEIHKFDVVVRLQNYHVYKLVKETSELRFLNSIILRPVILENPNDKFPETVLSFDTDKERSCWLSAMRLAKYGKQLRANYKAFRNKRPDPAFAGRSVDSMVPSGSEKSKCAMDFTGPVSRVVDDPLEARAIAMNEGYHWKQRSRLVERGCCDVSTQVGQHLFQPWYHGPMPREQANFVLSEVHIRDGTFLVRESVSGGRTGPVISYRHGNRVIHRAVNTMLDPQTKKIVLSIDYGATRFFDVTDLIEFYHLNKGCLPFRLLSHLMKEHAEEKAPEQAQVEAPEQAPVEALVHAPVEVPEQAPVEVPEQAPMEVVEQAPEEAPKEAPQKP